MTCENCLHNNQRILTTLQLADAYGTESIKIQQNFANNKDRYTPGKHYFCLEGETLKHFLNLHLEIFESQNLNKIRALYLWTERGAWLHAKSLNTDRAWQAYEMLVDEYYRIIQQPQSAPALPESTFDFHFTVECRSANDIERTEQALTHLKQARTLLTGNVSKRMSTTQVIPQPKKPRKKRIAQPLKQKVLRTIRRLCAKDKPPTFRDIYRYHQNVDHETIWSEVATLVIEKTISIDSSGKSPRYLMVETTKMIPTF